MRTEVGRLTSAEWLMCDCDKPYTGHRPWCSAADPDWLAGRERERKALERREATA